MCFSLNFVNKAGRVCFIDRLNILIQFHFSNIAIKNRIMLLAFLIVLLSLIEKMGQSLFLWD